MENHSSNDQQNPPKLGSCCCPPSSNNSQAIVPVAAVEEKNQLISKIIRILMRAVGIFVARKVILWAIGFGPYGVISSNLIQNNSRQIYYLITNCFLLNRHSRH